ncbi:MAG TPA: GNAT family N-acetyltransferase [Ramlibacter sp.]|uniref:GNAT family N-acetyltransferase n=1 Tax=Ramlibacter sp. TaxID=1917967 RepID=UPI002ED3AEBA
MDATHASSVPGLRLRPFAGDADFPLMARVANASFAADGQHSVRRPEDMRRDYAAFTSWDPSRDIRMAEIDGELVGYARTWDWTADDGAFVQGQLAFVHPDWRRRGVGTVLLQWLERRQREIARAHPHAPAWLHHAFVTEGEQDRMHLLRKAGYRPVRHFLEMERRGLDDIPDVPLPAGFEIRPVETEHLRAIYDAHITALQDHWGMARQKPEYFEGWQKSRTFQPHLWQVAWHVESRQVAGQVKPWIDAEQNETQQRRRGYTEFISVGAPWRRRGLARALVLRALRAQREAGMDESALGVDGENAHDAARLYEACGFRVVKRNAVYRKPVDFGAP